MHEFITRALYHFQVHLLYASLVGCAALILTSIRRGSATTKYWIWVAASLNFIFPVGALLDWLWSAHLSWATPLGVFGDAAGQISQGRTAVIVGVVWLVGAILMSARLGLRLRSERRDAQATAAQSGGETSPDFMSAGVPVRFAASRQTPAVDGVLHPYISLPRGIDRLLSERELNAVLIHEMTHARRRDNLIRLIYEAGLCALWFHPLVWIAGSRLALYRELSCDESVIERAHGEDLISALAKLANPEGAFLLQATASSFLGHRLARLAAQPQRKSSGASTLLALVFATVLIAGVVETVAHTACCFVTKVQAASCERKH